MSTFYHDTFSSQVAKDQPIYDMAKVEYVLTSSHLRCIGSTTYQEYRGIFDKDRALSRQLP